MTDAKAAAGKKDPFDDNFWLFGYGRRSAEASSGSLRLTLSTEPTFLRVEKTKEFLDTSRGTFGDFGSEDHRGTPEAPGRVVTLIERPGEEGKHPPRVWGCAYHIPPEHVAEVRSYLDIREINGYSIEHTPFQVAPESQHLISSPSDPGKTLTCLVYIGQPWNPQFLGPQAQPTLAAHILRSRGPSGENKDYLYSLEKALGELSQESEDEHITDLARRCRELEAQGVDREAQPMDPQAEKMGERHGGLGADGRPETLERIHSTNEQEEIEKKG